jgi:hypothetical protein
VDGTARSFFRDLEATLQQHARALAAQAADDDALVRCVGLRRSRHRARLVRGTTLPM